eukprot:4072981-Pleurochrysis_carterae.AAC.2
MLTASTGAKGKAQAAGGNVDFKLRDYEVTTELPRFVLTASQSIKLYIAHWRDWSAAGATARTETGLRLQLVLERTWDF